jgi:CBS domain containing-hemolysin-like protein
MSDGNDDNSAGAIRPPAAEINRTAPEPARRSTLRDWLRRVLRPRNGEASLRDTLEELIEEREEEGETSIDPAERVLLENIFKLRDLSVEDVMVPRADIVAVEVQTPLDEVIGLMGDSLHSRLPVFRRDLDDVLGIIHVKDVLAHSRSESPVRLSAILRRVLFVAPSMRVLDLLLQMRLSRVHLALVVDEFGGIDGLVTIEDLVEEIVGEIEDEHEIDEAPHIMRRSDGTLLADARTTLEEFEDMVGKVVTEEEREDVDTLGGLVVSLTGRVPSRGELIAHGSGLEFEVIDADPRRIKRLRIRNTPPSAAAR